MLAAAGPASPLLGPAFAEQIGRVRPDARIAVWRNAQGMPIAFLPHHRRGRVAHPIGAPISDYHGVVAAPGFDLEAGLAAAGLSAYRFSSTIVSDDQLGARPGFLIELDSEPETYLEALRQARPKSFKNYRRLGHKLEREFGSLRIETRRDRTAFETLKAWKRQQIARTGAYDFLRPAWIENLLQNLFVLEDPDLAGLMVNLYAGDRLVAGHFGVRAGTVYHPWIASTDPELADMAPGHVFLMQVISAMPTLGLRTYDLGPSHDHYKAPYSRSARAVVAGATFATAAGRTAEQAWVLAGARRDGLIGRLRRRMDVISASELTAAGRLQGYAATAAVAARRLRSMRSAA